MTNGTILNDGLALAMEWGEKWLQPTQERLALAHPELSPMELDRYDAACRKAMRYGHALVSKCWREPGQNQQGAVAFFNACMKQKYGWISEENLGRLYSQGMYYAWRNGDVPA